MTKTALWLNPITAGSTSLDITQNPHDVDTLAYAKLLTDRGYENVLHDVFKLKSRLSSYQPKILTDDLKDFSCDLVVLCINPFIIDFLNFRYWQSPPGGTIDKVTEFLDRHEGEVQVFLNDPRPQFQDMFLKEPGRHHGFRDHLKRAKIVVADDNFLRSELKSRAVISDYWRYVKVGEVRKFCETEDFFCVYPGLKNQNRARLKQIETWMGDTPGCYTIGAINVKGVPSLSDHKPVTLNEVLDVTSRSTTALVTGEATHTWLTPRVIQSLCQGTICSIHPEFPGRHHFPDDILRDQTFATAKDFDRSLLTEEIYERQLKFVKGLAEGQGTTS